MNPLLLTDFYKVHHHNMYPEGTTMIYSNLTPRKSRMKGVNEVVVFGIQHFVLEYLIKKFNEEFFNPTIKVKIGEEKFTDGMRGWTRDIYEYHKGTKKDILEEYSRHAGAGIDLTHIEKLWDLGYLPIEIKALPEGTRCPIGVPMLTIRNTHPDFAWLTNYLETLMSCMLWQPITSATIAYEYKKILSKYALETTGSAEFVQWQGHDFSMRGMSSVESAILSGMGHLTSFTGTDTIPAIYALESSYKASGLIGASVPATEHSVMCMGTKDDEIGTFKALLDKYPKGILSVVSDTWDLWKVCTEYLPKLKEQIMSRDGKLVIRPDSGNPVDIICGYTVRECKDWNDVRYGNIYDYNAVKLDGKYYMLEREESYEIDYGVLGKELSISEVKGVIELLWETFGGTINKYGYKELDPHIGAIYGDSITIERAVQICERLKAKGFASTNIVLGIGSYTYQYNTRDTFSFAVKATYVEVKIPVTQVFEYSHRRVFPEAHETVLNGYKIETREIFKDPITDDGTKRSKKGLLSVQNGMGLDSKLPAADKIGVLDQQTWEQEKTGLLETIFLNGKLIKEVTLQEIRDRLSK